MREHEFALEKEMSALDEEQKQKADKVLRHVHRHLHACITQGANACQGLLHTHSHAYALYTIHNIYARALRCEGYGANFARVHSVVPACCKTY